MSPAFIDFVGFYASLPVLLLALLILFSLGLSIFTYYGYTSISKWNKSFLIVLRASLFLLLGILLLNPVFESIKIEQRKPTIAVLVDQSASIGLNKGEWNGNTDLVSIVDQVRSGLDENYNIVWYGFDSGIFEIESLQDLTTDGSQTDIADALSKAGMASNADEILLVTDGVITRGRDPVFVAQSLSQPIHTIAIGDTSRVQDLILAYTDFSAEMVTQTEYAVVLGIRNEGFDGQETMVTLRQGERVLESKEIFFTGETSMQQVNFSLSSDSEGLRNYTVDIRPLPNEFTVENNSFNFSVNFVDNRIRILYLTYQFHPDNSIVKQILFEYPEISIQELTWTGTSFTGGATFPDIEDIDLVVIHGVPRSSQTTEINRIRELITEKNTVLFVVPGIQNAPVYSSIMGIGQGFVSNGDPITWTQGQIQANPSQSGHPVLDIQTYNWARSPLVTVMRSGISSSNNSLNLFQSTQFEGIPAVSSNRIGNYRTTFVTFSGFQNYFLSGSDEERDVITDIIGNVITWTATDVNQNLFEINTDKSEYSSRDNITFNARVFRDDGSPELDAIVSLSIVLTNNETREYALEHNGNGNYAITLPGLPGGDYTYTSKAARNNFQIGESTGIFSVGNPQLEFVNTQRNDMLLRQLSETSNGIYGVSDGVNEFVNELNSQVSLTTTERRDVFNLFKHPIWFLLAILLFTAEWLLRRRLLLP